MPSVTSLVVLTLQNVPRFAVLRIQGFFQSLLVALAAHIQPLCTRLMFHAARPAVMAVDLHVLSIDM